MITDKECFDENVDYESDSDVESEEGEDLECEDCGKVSENFDDYIEHRGMGGCAYYCYPCNETFRCENDLQRHKQKHCTKCSKEFSPEKILKKHKTNCKGFD